MHGRKRLRLLVPNSKKETRIITWWCPATHMIIIHRLIIARVFLADLTLGNPHASKMKVTVSR